MIEFQYIWRYVLLYTYYYRSGYYRSIMSKIITAIFIYNFHAFKNAVILF